MELSIEDKAKAYDKALERAIKLKEDPQSVFYEYSPNEGDTICDYIFPELKESEDEKMWKLIKKYAHYNISDLALEADHITREQLESWLKKQGEQANFINGIQVGDKVTRNEDGVLVNLTQLKRVANKGIEKAINEKQGEPNPAFDIDIPFGAKDSELIEQSYYIPEGFHAEIEGNNVIIKKGEKKSAWSEEDEKMFLDIESLIHSYRTGSYEHELSSWLESFKDRVQPQKQEWSEEDLNEIENALFGTYAVNVATRLLNKIKSLRPQSQWKPSDEQMRTLEHYTHTLFCTKHKEILFGLYSDLKKLKG